MNEMSMESWKEEFYPVTADEMKDRFDAGSATAADLIKHCLRKWEGARPENLKRHGLVKVASDEFIGEGVDEITGEDFAFDSISCALCVAHQDRNSIVSACGSCPLYISRDYVSCAGARLNEDDSPYCDFLNQGDPEPMIEALEDALAWVNRRSEKKG